MIRFLSTAYTPSTMPLSTAWASASRRRSVVVRSMRLRRDRKSTRLNSRHLVISYAVFCLKKKTDVHFPESTLKRDLSIETKSLRRLFKGIPGKGDVVALDQVDLEVHDDEIFGLLGPNGAGKTTLIKILCTLLLPTEGQALIKGLDVVKRASQIRRIINLVSGGETPGYGILSVKENLWFFSQLYGLPRDFAKDRIAKLVDQLELQDYLNTRMSKLSTGYKQRLNLARGFVNDPAVLFLDEPTLGLDEIGRAHV